MGAPGWRERYYDEKFSAKTPEEMEAVRKDVVSYIIFHSFLLVKYLVEVVGNLEFFYLFINNS